MMPFPSSSRRVALALACTLAAPLLATPAAAQRTAAETRAIDGYRLTMPMLRAVLPAMYGLGHPDCRSKDPGDVHAMPLAEMQRRIERCAPVMQRLGREGVTSSEAALAYAALLRASREVAMNGGKVSALPAGAIRDNAELLERNQAEIEKITSTAGGP